MESATPGNDIRQLTVPLASSGGGHVSKALRLTTTSEEVPNFMETSFDVGESHPNRIRPSYLFSGSSLDARPTSSPSTMLSRRVETASILTVMVVALAVSVHTMCVDDDINVHIVIKLPRSLLLGTVTVILLFLMFCYFYCTIVSFACLYLLHCAVVSVVQLFLLYSFFPLFCYICFLPLLLFFRFQL